MRLYSFHHAGIILGIIYALAEVYVGWKRPFGAGSLPALLWWTAASVILLIVVAWVNFKERHIYDRR